MASPSVIMPVSIHAPAWGATRPYSNALAVPSVSIHAPAWGATLTQKIAALTGGKFQSTHPRGVRRARVRCAGWPRACFNPRTRVGCDGAGLGYIPQDEVFQSTHPRGVRLRGVVRIPQDIDVSIHAPAWGATCGGGVVAPTAGVSIHAPAWGATAHQIAGDAPDALVSIHAPAWGATSPVVASPVPISSSFNPRTRVGCDLPSSMALMASATVFQSTHPRGVRQLAVQQHALGQVVSIHAPAWGAT